MYMLQSKDSSYHNLYKLFVWMICIRLVLYIMICFFMVCMTIFIIAAITTG